MPVASVFTIILSDAVTGEPISGATVKAIGEPVPDTENLFTETLTDSVDGEYDFYHTGGSYTIEIQAEGYISQSVSTSYLEGCGGARVEMVVQPTPVS